MVWFWFNPLVLLIINYLNGNYLTSFINNSKRLTLNNGELNLKKSLFYVFPHGVDSHGSHTWISKRWDRIIKKRQFGHREEKHVGNSVCLATPVKFSCAATDKIYSRIDATPDSSQIHKRNNDLSVKWEEPQCWQILLNLFPHLKLNFYNHSIAEHQLTGQTASCARMENFQDPNWNCQVLFQKEEKLVQNTPDFINYANNSDTAL